MHFDDQTIDKLTALVGAISALVAAIGVIVHGVLSYLGRKQIMAGQCKIEGQVLETKALTAEGTAKLTGSPLDISTAESTRAISDAHRETAIIPKKE